MKEPWSDPVVMIVDEARLDAVHRTGLLGSPNEEVFDRLTRLATHITGAPVSFFSVVDSDHDFFKSCYGVPEPAATARRVTGRSFCHFSLLGAEPLVVRDARADERFRELPSVKELGVVAYLGIPLHLGGTQPLGSFCVVDFVPRDWREEDIQVLREFATSVLREVELRMALSDLVKERTLQKAVQDRIVALVREPLTVLHLHTDLLQDANGPEEVILHLQGMRNNLQRIESFVVAVLESGHP